MATNNAINGSGTGGGIYKKGQTTRVSGSGTGTQNISHGLGVTPSLVRITTFWPGNTAGVSETLGLATTVSDEALQYQASSSSGKVAGQSSGYIAACYDDAAGNRGRASLDTLNSTTIGLNWTTAVDGSGTAYITWEAFG